MRFERTITLKDGRECILKNAAAHDTEEVCRTFRQTHAETDFLLSYPDEINMTVEKESEYLSKKEESENEKKTSAFEHPAHVEPSCRGDAGDRGTGSRA